MSLPPKSPPRFVPTLTDVVQWESGVPAVGQDEQAPQASSIPTATASSPLAPPAVAVTPQAAKAEPPQAAAANPASAFPQGIEELVIHRVMQRVDLVLDQRLREAIATVLMEQTRSIVPRLREEVESVVRYAVYEAVAEELASQETPPPSR